MAQLPDFQRYNLATGDVHVGERALLLTVDFEAFEPSRLEAWLHAMESWSTCARRGNWRYSVFLAVEDVMRLRAADPDRYRRFLGAARELFSSGAVFYPHNHGIFDLETGLRPLGFEPLPQVAPGYAKRTSLFYDAVYRNRLHFTEWLRSVMTAYRTFLSDARLPEPRPLCFRPGGWDHGSTRGDLNAYLDALSAMGVSIDSGDSSGEFERGDYRVGSSVGANVYRLARTGLTEVAPCWFLDCGATLASRGWISASLKLIKQVRTLLPLDAPGAFVVVAHFDHLFNRRGPLATSLFSSTEERSINHRIHAFFRRLDRVRRVGRFESLALGDVSLDDHSRDRPALEVHT